jgi:catechol 2,3-dioxygenase-like lactoylglutathione lyase family enzyme
MTSQRRLISFASSVSSSKARPRLKENGPAVLLDSAISASKLPCCARRDGHGRLELSRFLNPPVVADHRNAPVNALGYLRVMFTVDDIDDTLERLRKRGAQLVGEVVRYEDAYRLCYIRGPEGLLTGLAQELS